MFKPLSIALAVALTGCASTPELIGEDGQTSLLDAHVVYTQTNLHPDLQRKRLYSINYQQAGLIPRCSEVYLEDVSAKKLIFSYQGQKYQYLYHKASGSFDDNIKKYFATSCDKSLADLLNEQDQKGINEGKIFQGMTKKGVTLAIGYPPQHVTPSLDSDSWKYWKNRFVTFMVNFDENGLTTANIHL